MDQIIGEKDIGKLDLSAVNNNVEDNDMDSLAVKNLTSIQITMQMEECSHIPQMDQPQQTFGLTRIQDITQLI
jgi:hypothetical protein